jgi:hypothetical protein
VHERALHARVQRRWAGRIQVSRGRGAVRSGEALSGSTCVCAWGDGTRWVDVEWVPSMGKRWGCGKSVHHGGRGERGGGGGARGPPKTGDRKRAKCPWPALPHRSAQRRAGRAAPPARGPSCRRRGCCQGPRPPPSPPARRARPPAAGCCARSRPPAARGRTGRIVGAAGCGPPSRHRAARGAEGASWVARLLALKRAWERARTGFNFALTLVTQPQSAVIGLHPGTLHLPCFGLMNLG